MKQRIIGSYNKLKETNILSNFFNLGGIQISNILLLLLTIRIITGVVGLAEFGIIMSANRFSQFTGTFINYGTNQSAIRDTAANVNNRSTLGIVFYNTLWIRAIIFALFLIVLLSIQNLSIPYYSYILFAIPIILAEVFNPLCFFIGIEKLRVFNIINLVFNALAVLALLIFIKERHNAGWVNFILGTANLITYIGLFIYLIAKLKIPFHFPLRHELQKVVKNNFYLTVNNISVNLQQYIIVFALTYWGNATVLGAYIICDRVIGQCRNLLITISNSIYPNAVHIYRQSTDMWNVYRQKTKYIIAGIFFAGAILIFILADFIVVTLAKEHNATAVLFLRIMAFVPVISAFNMLNVLDQLLKNNTVYIFRIAAILLLISVVLAYILLNLGNYQLIGAFTLMVEMSALLMYEFGIRKPSIHNG